MKIEEKIDRYLVNEFNPRGPEDKLRSIVDAEYESLVGLSKKEFYDWASGFIKGLTRKISDKVYKSIF